MTPLPALPAFLLLAAGGEPAETFLGLPYVLWNTVNLILFFGLVVYLARKPLTKFLGGRRAEIEALLAKAEEDRRRAAALSAELQARLAQIETELAGVKAAARKEAEAEQEALLQEAEREAGRLVERMKGEIESRVRHARAELTAYAGDLSLEMARELLREKMTADDRARLAADGVEALAKAKA